MAGLVAVLLFAELGMRVAAPRLIDPREHSLGLTQPMVAEMDSLQAVNQRTDLLFVGTSMVEIGVDVEPFTELLADAPVTHKVALTGAQTTIVERWLLEEVVPRLDPKRVVWGVSSTDFNGNWPAPLDKYNEGRAVRPGTLAAIDRRLAAASYLVRYRANLRDPLTLFNDLMDAPPREADTVSIHHLTNKPGIGTSRNHQTRRHLEESVLGDFEVGRDHVGSFRRTVRTLREAGVEVTIVVMPVPDEYLAAHPRGAADYEDFLAMLAAETESLAVPVLDYGDMFTTDAFADYTHLKPATGLQFSEALARDLAAMGW